MNRFTTLIVSALVVSTSSARSSADPGLDDILAKRMSYVTSSFEANGGPCKISEPKLILDVVPSFGMYDDADNALHITTWDKLPPEAHSAYARMVNAHSQAEAQAIYEKGTYNWVFVHELGHWWQHCKGNADADSYAREAGANRIASTFWRTTDPELMSEFGALFARLERSIPDPLPAGADRKAYFNQNYDALGHNPSAYIWFQAAMVVDAYEERPIPLLKQVLLHPTDVAPGVNSSVAVPK